MLRTTGSILLSASLFSSLACSGSGGKNAGIITEENAAELLMEGVVAHGAVGDYYLKNDKMTVIIERPGRVFSVTPYGGNIIDIAPVGTKRDVFGESIPFMQFGMTANFDRVRVLKGGSDTKPAVIEARGTADIWDFLNIQSFLPGILEYVVDDEGNPLGIIKFDPRAPLPVDVRATYTLAPGADFVEVRYFLENTSRETIDLRGGFVLDVRGEVEPFADGRGFTDPAADVNDIGAILTGEIDTPYIAYQTDEYSIGVRSRDFLDGQETPRLALGIVGIAIVVIGAPNLIEFLDTPGSIILEPGDTQGFGFDLYLGQDIADVTSWARDGASNPGWGELQGTVTEVGSGAPIPGVRIAALDPITGDVETSFTTIEDGSWGGFLPAGDYRIVADDLSRDEDPGRTITVTASEIANQSIEMSATGTVNFQVNVADDPFATTSGPGPCRVLLLGEAPARRGGICGVTATCGTNEPFRHAKRFELSAPEPYVRYFTTCDTIAGADEPLVVRPGRYLAVVSRGPEYDFLEELIDVVPGSPVTVAGTIHRAVDSTGWAASEFHVHQVHSPDSIVPLVERAKSMASAGVDYFATTDHDAVTDMRPIVEQLGLTGEVTTDPGTEVSTIDIGHFNAFPVEPAPDRQYGAPPDWAGQWNRPPPEDMFEGMRRRGAQVVQVNHPRGSSSYFGRLGVQYDLDAGTIAKDPDFAPTNELMLMRPGEPLFSSNFDAIEVYNGDTPLVLRDWFNLLSMGLTVTGTAPSDTHGTYTRAAGNPRTYVAVATDRPDAVVSQEVMDGVLAGRAVGSNGPVMDISVVGSGATVGDITPSVPGADVVLDLRVQTPSWYEVNSYEVFVTRSYADPRADEQLRITNNGTPEPAANFTGSLTSSVFMRPNGGSANVYTTQIVLDAATLDAIHAAGSDGWLVVRVTGPGSGLYPVYLSGGSASINASGTTPETFATYLGGDMPFAYSNPIYLDRNSDGDYDPPFPLQ